MKVYVVMGNDDPVAVFKLAAEAVKFCADKKKEQGTQKPAIYWRAYEFELQ
jgi:Icc-related predicted phosphoesterase